MGLGVTSGCTGHVQEPVAVPRDHCAQGLLYPGTTVPKDRHTQGPLCPGITIPRDRCAQGSPYPGTAVLRDRCTSLAEGMLVAQGTLQLRAGRMWWDAVPNQRAYTPKILPGCVPAGSSAVLEVCGDPV